MAKGMRAYTVHIVGLTNAVHQFSFEVENEFFRKYGSTLVSEGSLTADVALDKRETFIEATFSLSGSIKLICDRSLEAFDQPIRTKKKLVFKYGDADEELSDEIVIIRRDTESLELGQYIYEFIALEIPMKKLHPRFREEDDEDQSSGKIIYSSGSTDSEDRGNSDDLDPRWEKLKKLK